MTGAKCSRLKCTRVASRQGLCNTHYESSAVVRGYVDAGPVLEHVQLLMDRGMGWRGLADATGLSQRWFWLIQRGGRVQAGTARRVLAVPVPPYVVAGGEVPAIGTIRRIRALAAIGWPAAVLSRRLGYCDKYLSQFGQSDTVQSRSAAKVDALYRELNTSTDPCRTCSPTRRPNCDGREVPPLRQVVDVHPEELGPGSA